jgi:anthranilate synthase/aminodeoxychorismate synthase-like glutamine amidotransferase
MKILVIDNYDSFTYNLVQLLGKEKNELIVKRNDEITLDFIDDLNPEKILISPGPGRPEKSGISLEVIKIFKEKIPILGVCLGYQAIAYAFGSQIVRAKELMHGKVSKINHDSKTIFRNVEQKFEAMRYHSLVVAKDSLAKEIEISAETEDGTVMGLRHKNFPLEGIQFHPESILTTEGEKILLNWLRL